MKVTGIICEYNPFHNGHRYHIAETRRRFGSDYVIGIMSGCFTQRGMPAIVDKYSRAHMALLGGCDAVLELPVRYATSSAEGFAHGAVGTLIATGVCNSLSFGTEQGSLDGMKRVADILENEPEEFSSLLSDNLKKGMSYPAAREQALSEYIGHAPGYSYEPNNILGIEYLRACNNSGIETYTIKRTDNGYHSTDIPDNTRYISAEAIRNSLSDTSEYNSMSHIDNYIPEFTKEFLHDTVDAEHFAAVLYHSLITNDSVLESYVDLSDDIASRIRDHISEYNGVDSFIRIIKTKSYTYTRIARALTHCMLGITALTDCETKYPVPYIRVLGFRKESSALMRMIQDNATVPVISRPARTEDLDSTGKQLFAEDIRAAGLYNHVRYLGRANASEALTSNEFNHGIIIV